MTDIFTYRLVPPSFSNANLKRGLFIVNKQLSIIESIPGVLGIRIIRDSICNDNVIVYWALKHPLDSIVGSGHRWSRQEMRERLMDNELSNKAVVKLHGASSFYEILNAVNNEVNSYIEKNISWLK